MEPGIAYTSYSNIPSQAQPLQTHCSHLPVEGSAVRLLPIDDEASVVIGARGDRRDLLSDAVCSASGHANAKHEPAGCHTYHSCSKTAERWKP